MRVRFFQCTPADSPDNTRLSLRRVCRGWRCLNRSHRRALTLPARLWSNAVMGGGRTLAVDYGTRNVGLACTDESGTVVRPMESIPNRGRSALRTEIGRIARELCAKRVVIGIPRNMDGTSGEAVGRVERFMQDLRSELQTPLVGVDERLSTVEAMDLWMRMKDRQRKRYRSVDSLAAALILERFLAEHPC